MLRWGQGEAVLPGCSGGAAASAAGVVRPFSVQGSFACLVGEQMPALVEDFAIRGFHEESVLKSRGKV